MVEAAGDDSFAVRRGCDESVVQVLKDGFRATLEAAADDLSGGRQQEGP
jgi:hypothetical protein